MYPLPTSADQLAASTRAPVRLALYRRQRQSLGIWSWACLLALVFLAQALGQMHNVLHAAAPQDEILAQRSFEGNDHAQEASHWLGRLFAGHDSASDCRLYDQISHGDCVPTAALLPALALHTPIQTTASPASAQVRPTLRVQARGPPIQS